MNTPLIQNHTFQWTALAHKTSCSGHQFTAACKADHVGPHTSSCPSACSSTCTQAHTHSTGCSDPHYYDCGDRCQRQIAYCKDWDWLETSLKLSINNTLQSEYPDILATKQGYNTEPSTGGLVKKYFEVTRTSTGAQQFTNSNWDYVAILMRGQDKLTIAQYQSPVSTTKKTEHHKDVLFRSFIFLFQSFF